VVDFFGVEVEAAVVELIDVSDVSSEHIKKLYDLMQVAKLGAFLGATLQQNHSLSLLLGFLSFLCIVGVWFRLCCCGFCFVLLLHHQVVAEGLMKCRL